MMTGKTWSPGDSKNDPQMGAAMTLCGGVCTVEYSDGSEMEIMATNLGVIQYQFVPGKGQKPVGQPVVVAVKSRQGQRYSAPQWQKALGLAMIVAAFIAAVQESINWIRSLPLLLNPSGPGGPGNAGDGPGGVDIMGGGGEGHLGCCAD